MAARTPLSVSSPTQVQAWMGDALVGQMVFQADRGRETVAFHYDEAWLASGFSISPDLPLGDGWQYFARKPGQAGGFPMCLHEVEPSGWGRRVMDCLAGKQWSPRSTLDFLRAVDDTTRIGALRFKIEERFERELDGSLPSMAQLGRVDATLRRVGRGQATAADRQALWTMGTSLGGVRPKCSAVDTTGDLVLVKFGANDDGRDLVRGEQLALALARMCGIEAARGRIETYPSGACLVLERFDRVNGRRVPYLSAGALLGLDRHDVFSYQQLIGAIERYSPDPDRERVECWKRMLFNFLICNIDDHSRNHGFLQVGGDQWTLAPAFDLNPFIDKARVLKTLLLDDGSRVENLQQIVAAGAIFGVGETMARESLGQMARVIGQWRQVARSSQVGMKEADIREFSSAFDPDLLAMAGEMARG